MKAATYIAEPGQDGAGHSFGGEDWTVGVPESSSPAPAVILTLQTSDERLTLGWPPGLLPLSTRMDAALPRRQAYVVRPEVRRVDFEAPAWHATGDQICPLPNPLPARPLALRPVRGNEDLAAAPDRYEVQDTFLGGSGFLRIGGEPVWLLDPERVECTCGQQMRFIACVGYENYTNPSGLVGPQVAFFLGELALYFFGCQPCARVVVAMQPA